MRKGDVPTSPEELAETLRELRLARRKLRNNLKAQRPARRALSQGQRKRVLEKTAGRCHICGGEVDGRWHADHVLAHSGGGLHSIDNYLPAHAGCNSSKWDFTAEEFQYILRIGIWTRREIEHRTATGMKVATGFLRYERTRRNRQKSNN